MSTDIGFFNEYTGDQSDGNFYCNMCGDHVPVGFKHHHASDVPRLEKQVAELERQLAHATDKKQEENKVTAEQALHEAYDPTDDFLGDANDQGMHPICEFISSQIIFPFSYWVTRARDKLREKFGRGKLLPPRPKPDE